MKTFQARAFRARWLWPVSACLVLCGGCASLYTPESHAVEFSTTIVDAASGNPVSGVSAVVIADDKVLFDGMTGEDGALTFSTVLPHRPRSAAHVSEAGPETYSMTIAIDAGDYGVVEIPVRFDRGTRKVSLGEIRLIEKGNR